MPIAYSESESRDTNIRNFTNLGIEAGNKSFSCILQAISDISCLHCANFALEMADCASFKVTSHLAFTKKTKQIQ